MEGRHAMGRRNDHTREELKELILKTSWNIVGKYGFEGLTARHVAKEIGYAAGTIYNIFESMDVLCLLINARTLDILHQAIAGPECNDPEKSPAENMVALAMQYMDFVHQYRPYWLMLFNPVFEDSSQVKSWYQKKMDELLVPLERLLDPLFGPGEAGKRQMAAGILWSSVHGFCLLHETGKIPLKSVPGETLAHMIETYIRGIEKS